MIKFIILFFISILFFNHAFAQDITTEVQEPGKYFYPAYKGGKYGYINQTGQWMIVPKYDWCGYFYDGYAVAKDTGKFGIINVNGEWLSPPAFDTIKHFNEGYAAFGSLNNEGKLYWDMIDTTAHFMNFKVPALSNLTSMCNGITIGTEEGFIGFYFLNPKGERVFEAKDFYLDENKVPDFSEGMLHVHLPDGTSTFIDTTGQLWGKGNYEDCGDFHEGMSWYRDNLKYGYINWLGEKVIAPTYDSTGDFSEGIALVKTKMIFNSNAMRIEGGVVGYIDREGKPVTPAIYEAGSAFTDSLALVKYKGKYGFIDTKGNTAIDFIYNDAFPFMRGLAFVRQDNHWMYINTKGKKVF